MATAANPRGTSAKDKAAVAMAPSDGKPPPPGVPAAFEPPGDPPFCWKFKSGIIMAIPIMPAPNAPAV